MTPRKLVAMVAIAATVAASLPAAPAVAQVAALQTGAAPVANPELLFISTIKAFPNGGEPLKLAFSDLIVAHPNLASSLAAYLRSNPDLSPAQKQAVIAGLADGLNRLGVVAQFAGGLDPAFLTALLVVGGAAVGFGIYESTKTGSVSPN